MNGSDKMNKVHVTGCATMQIFLKRTSYEQVRAGYTCRQAVNINIYALAINVYQFSDSKVTHRPVQA